MNRLISRRLILTLLAAFLTLSGVLFPFGRARASQFCSTDISLKFEESAENYLRQTARILGDRYQDDFYRTAVQTQLKRFWERRTEEIYPRREYFLDFDSDDALSEAFAFLDEAASGGQVGLADVVYISGNPLNAVADSLIKEISPWEPISSDAGLRVEIPLWRWFAFLFSLPFLLAASFPVSPLAGIGGAGSAALGKFFLGLTSFFFPFSRTFFHGCVRSWKGDFLFSTRCFHDRGKPVVLRL